MPSRFGWLPKARWKRVGLVGLVLGVLLVREGILLVVPVAVDCALLWQIPVVKGWAMVQMIRRQPRQPTEIPRPPALTPDEISRLATQAKTLRSAGELFVTTNVWDVRLRFRSNQWLTLGPNVVPPVAPFFRPDGSVVLRNPRATRNGLAGVLGIDFGWSEAHLEFADVSFDRVGARFKGNGTFLESQRSYKRSFKIDLNRSVKSQGLVARKTLNFHNLIADASCLSDALAYEFFRDAGVPASRTAFARLRLSVEDRFQDGLLGLYVLVENPDADWARERFGVPGVALFKPVTYELFKDLGSDWKAYEGIYDPKTKTTAKQQRRLIELARFVSHADNAEFSSEIGRLIDLDEFATFLACEVMLANYDGILSNGQNFLLYLDPRNNLFGFIPWDLDHSWGEFGLIGTVEQRERASLWHPWVGENQFLQRMLDAEPVRSRYRQEIQRIRSTLFLPDRLGQRLDDLATIVRPFVAEESNRRLARFERAVGESRTPVVEQPAGRGNGRSVFSHKRFFARRAESVSDQLEGRAEGVILTRRPMR
jgi:spore coat protein H